MGFMLLLVLLHAAKLNEFQLGGGGAASGLAEFIQGENDAGFIVIIIIAGLLLLHGLKQGACESGQHG